LKATSQTVIDNLQLTINNFGREELC
jgi:hypothetical protein